jgi:GNAT superfamily N-acetyltransferase
MKNKPEVRSLDENDIDSVSNVLSDWLSKEEVDHYIKSIQDIIVSPSPKPKFDSHYYVALLNEEIIGVAGFRVPIPKLVKFASTKTPAELCMLYVAKEHRGGKGIGTILLNHIIDQAKIQGYQELIVRSAEKFVDTGWGFYDHMGFDRVGQLLPSGSEKKSQIWSKKL